MRLSLIALAAALGACASSEPLPLPEGVPYVVAAVETAPVGTRDDAADDPAIWVNAAYPAASLVLATDKNAGLYVYDLLGAERQFLAAGALNNVDLRQNVAIGAWRGDLAAASNRSDNTLTLFTLTDGVAAVSGKIASPIVEPYGACMGASGDEVFGFITYKTGEVVMFALSGPDGGAERVRLKLASQLEGCVFDDEAGILYIGEEGRGLWKSVYADGALQPATPVDAVGGPSGIVADIEGVALYKTGPETGYLIASSQGDYSYAVYEREGANRFIGRFAITDGEAADAVQETDGLEATSAALGPDFPKGVLVVQDGFNAPAGSTQNYKIVDWRAIEEALGL